MQITRGMRLMQAKEYVAQKLGVSLMDLSDPVAMLEVRKERGLGSATEAGEILYVDDPVGLEAKFHIADLLEDPRQLRRALQDDDGESRLSQAVSWGRRRGRGAAGAPAAGSATGRFPWPATLGTLVGRARSAPRASRRSSVGRAAAL